jgi:hypothetical protein
VPFLESAGQIYPEIKENIKTAAKETLGLQKMKQHKAWFDEECLGFLDQRKLTKMLWLKETKQSIVDNPNTVRHETSRLFRNQKKRKYLKAKIEKLENNSKIKKNTREFYRGISDFEKGYQPRTTITKNDNSDLAADSHRIWLGGGTIIEYTWG